MPPLSAFRANQVVKCISLADHVGEGWRIGDLGVVSSTSTQIGSYPLRIKHARPGFPHNQTLQSPNMFEPVVIQPVSKVRVVGFQNCWAAKWLHPVVFLDEIGTVGIARRIVTYIDAILSPDCYPRQPQSNSTWGFSQNSTIPELIPYQPDDEFDVAFWQDLWMSHDRSPQVSVSESRSTSMSTSSTDTHIPQDYEITVEDDSRLPEPIKTIYDADF